MLLINPRSPFLMDERVFPSLGVLRVAEAADCPVLDLAGADDWQERVGQAINGHDLIGITATTPQMPAVTKLAEFIRRNSGAELVIGGPHVTMCYTGSERAEPHRTRLETTFDAVVVGDGEMAIKDVLDGQRGVIRADRRTDPDFLQDGDVGTGRDRIDIASYRYEIDGHPATSLIAQLGCPFGCNFCGGRNSHAFRVIRKRSIASVVGEIEGLYRDYGFTGFMFYDDELNVNPNLNGLLDALVALQERLGVDMRFRGFIKAELFTDEMAAKMVRAGFRWLLCGFEGAHPRILKNIRKRATVEDNTRVIEIADRHGLKVKALMSVGHPGEDEQTIRRVEDWLIEMQPEDFDCTVITPYPGSPYYDDSRRNNGRWTFEVDGDALHSLDVDYSVQADFYKGVPGEYRSYVFTDCLSAQEIVAMRDDLERRCRAVIGPSPSLPAHQQFEHSMGQN